MGFLHLTEILTFVEYNIPAYFFLSNPIFFHLLSYILNACPDCISPLLRIASTLLAVVQNRSKDDSVKDEKATDRGNADESAITCANCVKNEQLEKERARIFAKQKEDFHKKLYDNCITVCTTVSKQIGMEYEKEISRLRKIIEEKTSDEKGSCSDNHSIKTVNNCRQRRTQKRQALQQKWQPQHEQPVQQELFLQGQPVILQQQQQIQQQEQQLQIQQQQLQIQQQQLQKQQQQIQQQEQQLQQQLQIICNLEKNSPECSVLSGCGRRDCIHFYCREQAKNSKKPTSTPRLWTRPTFSTYIPQRQRCHSPPEEKENEDSGYSFSSEGSNESLSQSDTYMGSGYDSY